MCRFKAQKGSKDVMKVVHVTLVVQLKFYEATRTFCSKKTKIKTLLNFLSIVFRVSVLRCDLVMRYLYSLCTKYCHSYFNDVLATFLGLERVGCCCMCRIRKLSDFINEGLMCLERHEGE